MGSKNDERMPINDAKPARSSAVTVALAATVIAFSVGLINFNKWLMHANRFPYAGALVFIHQILGTFLAGVLFMVRPSFFPAITDPVRRVNLTARFYVTGFMPVACVFSTSLILGNLAYLYLPLAFIQMIKESNLVWTYLLSLVCAMEIFGWNQFKIICFGLLSMSLTVTGQLQFNLIGFIIQLTAVLCESVRITLQGILLSGTSLDPLSYLLLVSPACALLLGTALLGLTYIPGAALPPGLAPPSYAALYYWAPCLLANSMLAFCLNVSISLLLKRVSPVSYLMTQILKDVVAVLGGIFFLKEQTTKIQCGGFVGQLFTVVMWSAVKTAPESFAERGLIAGLGAFLSGLAGHTQKLNGKISPPRADPEADPQPIATSKHT